MLSGTSLANTTFALLQGYQVNAQFLNDSASKLVSGKKLQHPSDNIVDYFRSERINRENSQDDYISRGIQEASSFSTVTETVGNNILTQVQALEVLVNKYWDPHTDPDTKGGIAMEFSTGIDVLNAYINNSNDPIDNTTSQKLYSTNGGNPFRSVTLDATDPTQTLDISFNANDIVNVANLQAINLGTTTQAAELASVQNEETKAGNYLSKAVANTISLQSQYNLIQNQITQNSKYNDVINTTDTAQESAAYTNMVITQQMTQAMVAQGNMQQSTVLALFKNM